MEKAELVVIGAGPGGLSAAVTAASMGANVTILDQNSQIGGQIFRQFEQGFEITDAEALGKDYQKGRDLFARFKELEAKITYLNRASVWGIFDHNRIAYGRNGESKTIEFKNLVIAAGAYDRPVPFPGWTLPGVFTAGGAQNLVKNQRVLPGKKVLLAGTGPLQLVVAHQLISNGAEVVAILEAGDVKGHLFQLTKGVIGNWHYVTDGLRYMKTIRKAGVPILRNHLIVRTNGREHVEEAVVARVDQNWRVIPGTEKSFNVDAVCIGYGLVTSNELTRLAECEHVYDGKLGGYVPVRSENLETTRKGVFAVGDGAGVAGAEIAVLEGEIAGIAAAGSLGHGLNRDSANEMQGVQSRLSRYATFRQAMDEISRPRPGLYELAEDDTVICRCEDVTYGQIKELAKREGIKAKDIKRETRTGMGSCNGKMCGTILMHLLQDLSAQTLEQPEGLNVRPPVRPISLGVLAGTGDNR